MVILSAPANPTTCLPMLYYTSVSSLLATLLCPSSCPQARDTPRALRSGIGCYILQSERWLTPYTGGGKTCDLARRLHCVVARRRGPDGTGPARTRLPVRIGILAGGVGVDAPWATTDRTALLSPTQRVSCACRHAHLSSLRPGGFFAGAPDGAQPPAQTLSPRQ